MVASGKDTLMLARKHVGERYVLGALAPKNNAKWTGPWDCAEFTSWLVFQTTGKLYGVHGTVPSTADAYTGFWGESARAKGKQVSVSVASATPGAFVLRLPKPGAIGHVAVCDGKGGTVEAHSTKKGVIASVVAGRRWDMGILVPGIDYGTTPESPTGVSGPSVIFRFKRTNMMRGPKVRAIQQALKKAGISPGPIDGEFGALTHAAVVAFQRINGLVVDGEVGPETAKHLKIDLS